MNRRSTAFHESGKGAEALQGDLWHDTVLDACGSVVKSVGGVKHAASLLWPNDPMARAEQRLRECLNGDRPQRFSPEELMRLMRLGREAGDHSIMHYLCSDLGYTEPSAIEPEDQRAALQRQVVSMGKQVIEAINRLERMQR